MQMQSGKVCVAVTWFQYLHPENVKQSSHALLPATKREQHTQRY